jgi:hypothetical protein
MVSTPVGCGQEEVDGQQKAAFSKTEQSTRDSLFIKVAVWRNAELRLLRRFNAELCRSGRYACEV